MEKQSNKIKELRISKNLSQEELSEKSGVSLRTIQRLESGGTEARGQTLQKLAKIFGVDYNNLIKSKNIIKKNNYNKIDKYSWVIIISFIVIGSRIGPVLDYFLPIKDYKMVDALEMIFGAIGAIIAVIYINKKTTNK
jgi:transcriptional regulator with XRE-family HTH domain